MWHFICFFGILETSEVLNRITLAIIMNNLIEWVHNLADANVAANASKHNTSEAVCDGRILLPCCT